MSETPSADDPPVVLIVDDEPDVADLYASYLEEDYEVLTVYGGEEAVDALRPEIDVVLLDRRMRNVNGDEVLREIRQREIDCRVVMVTAVDPTPDVVSMDFDDYLVKPVSEETLRNAVDRMMTRNALDRNLLDAFALASKMATLEAKMSPAELEDSEEYAKLQAEFDEFRELVQGIDPTDSLYAELSAMKIGALFADE